MQSLVLSPDLRAIIVMKNIPLILAGFGSDPGFEN